MAAKTTLLTLLALVGGLLLAAPASADTSFVVNDAGDADDASFGNGQCDTDLATAGDQCTLRAAFSEANNQAGTGPFNITFSLPASTTIQTTGNISANAGKQMVIDGCGASPGNDPCVGLRSSTSSTILGFQATSSVGGLAISSTANASEGVFGSGGALTVKRSWLGIGLDGSAGPLGAGVRVRGNNSVIGGTTPAERNVFANDTTGLLVESGDNTVVRGNYFGVNSNGTTAGVSGNGTNVAVTRSNTNDAPENTVIGGTLDSAAQASAACDGACNLISRATASGIDLDGNAGLEAGTTTIAGNYIGTSLDGTAKLENASRGIDAGNAGPVLVGGPTAGDRNVVAGSTWGILEGTGGGALTIRNNYIGTNATGTAALPAVNNGVALQGNTAPSVLRDNVIAHAAGTGNAVELGSVGASVTGNSIGVGSGGEDLPMGGAIRVTGQDNVIGGTGPGDANVIGNSSLVAAITVDSGDQNTIAGNYIGVDANGTPRPNFAGVRIRTFNGFDATDNVVGGDQAAAENVISNSVKDAVLIAGTGTGNSVLRNRGSNNGQQFIDVGSQGGNDSEGNGPGNPGPENGSVLAPQISGTPTTLAASGTAAPNATVRVFITPSANGADPNAISQFVGEATADGAGDWTLTYPAPIPNDSRIAATQTLTGGSTGELTAAKTVADATPPQTSINTGPSGPIRDATPTWTFSSEAGATFECRIDGAPFASCSSPFTPAASLADGQHTFRVRAKDAAGNLDSTPATRSFKVDTKRPASKAAAPSSTHDSPFKVTYTGSDQAPASGLAAVELWARRPRKAGYSKVATDTTPTTTRRFSYNPSGGSGTYRFYTRARDKAGNYEKPPGTPDTTTVFSP